MVSYCTPRSLQQSDDRAPFLSSGLTAEAFESDADKSAWSPIASQSDAGTPGSSIRIRGGGSSLSDRLAWHQETGNTVRDQQQTRTERNHRLKTLFASLDVVMSKVLARHDSQLSQNVLD